MCLYLEKGNCYHGIGAGMLRSSYATAVEHNTICSYHYWYVLLQEQIGSCNYRAVRDELKEKVFILVLTQMTRKEVSLTILQPTVPAMLVSSYALLLNIIPAPK